MTRDNNQLKADKHMSTATRVAMHALNDLFSTIQHNLPFVRMYHVLYVDMLFPAWDNNYAYNYRGRHEVGDSTSHYWHIYE